MSSEFSLPDSVINSDIAHVISLHIITVGDTLMVVVTASERVYCSNVGDTLTVVVTASERVYCSNVDGRCHCK